MPSTTRYRARTIETTIAVVRCGLRTRSPHIHIAIEAELGQVVIAVGVTTEQLGIYAIQGAVDLGGFREDKLVLIFRRRLYLKVAITRNNPQRDQT